MPQVSKSTLLGCFAGIILLYYVTFILYYMIQSLRAFRRAGLLASLLAGLGGVLGRPKGRQKGKFLTLRAARRPRLFTLNAFDSGHDTSSGWSALSSNAALKQSSDWGPPGAQGRGSGAPGGPRGPFGAPGGVFCGCFPFRLEFFRPKARSVEKTQVCTLSVSGDPLGANLDEKTRRSRLRVHLVEKTRA